MTDDQRRKLRERIAERRLALDAEDTYSHANKIGERCSAKIKVDIGDLTALLDDLDSARQQLAAAQTEIATMKRGYVDLHAMLPGNKDVWSKVDDLKKQLAAVTAARDSARAAFDQLRNDIDGYDMCFEHARWIAEGRPDSFDTWISKYYETAQEWDAWKP